MNGPREFGEDDIDSAESEVSGIIEQWQKEGFIDLPSGTISGGFFRINFVHCKTLMIYKRAIEEIFRTCMEIRFESALEKGLIARRPQQAMRVLSGDEIVNTSESDIFVGNYIIQMKHYYALFLEWQ